MKTLLAALAWIVAWGVMPAPAEEGVPLAQNLQQDGSAAKAKGAAVLVVFVGSHCPFCTTALKEVLIPTSRNPDYQRKLVMRRIESRSGQALIDFAGRRITHKTFAAQHKITLVPTVMLFDDRGELLAKPMVGINTVDQYGYDLDQAIDQAMARLVPSPP